jgi:hypothetical protein
MKWPAGEDQSRGRRARSSAPFVLPEVLYPVSPGSMASANPAPVMIAGKLSAGSVP